MIALDMLVRLACNDLQGEEESVVEQHVLECNECARTLEGLLVAGEALRAMLASGDHRVPVPVTSSIIERLEAAGAVTRRYVLAPGSTVACTVDAEDVYTVVFYEGDFAGAARVDVEFAGSRVVDIPFEPALGRLAFLTPAVELRKVPTMKLPLRVVAFNQEGHERTVGEYVLDHTAFAE